MADIGSGIPHAGRASASFLNGPVVCFISGIEQIPFAFIGIDMSMPPVSGGIHTVKEIHAPLHTFQYIGRRSHTHQICGLLQRQTGNGFFQNMIHLFMSLSHCKSSDCVAVQWKLRNLSGMFPSDIRKYSSLIDPEQKLFSVQSIFQSVQSFHFLLTPHQPPGGPFHRSLHIGPVCTAGRTFIKGHRNSRA